MKLHLDHTIARKSIKFLGLTVLGSALTVATVALGVYLFMRLSFGNVPEIDQTPPNDLTVVLAGGRNRIRQALDLIGQGRSKRLLIIGAGQGITADQIIPSKDWPVGVAR